MRLAFAVWKVSEDTFPFEDDCEPTLDNAHLSPSTLCPGCTLGELWQFLSVREQPISLQLDEPCRQYIWGQLLQCTGPSQLIRFYRLPEPREDKQSLRPSPVAGREYHHPFPYRPVMSKDGRIKGSCATYKQRRDITKEILERNLTLDEAIEE